MSEQRIALVTGANRGLGFAVCQALGRQHYKIIFTSRDPEKGVEKAAQLEDEKLDVTFCQLDVSDENSIASLHETVSKHWGRLDVLVNNAAVLLDKMDAPEANSLKIEKEILLKTFETNVVGAYQLCELFLPLMRQQRYGRIVNVSSQAGQLSDMQDGYPAYRISKSALNAVTRIFAAQGRGHNVLVNSVDPGWVKTDMGGPQAPRQIEEGIDTIVWAATLPDSGPSGAFLRDRQLVSW
jgi:NAD(P)-dependent dehydrogenase (short-subunit alcohol dehydrogenase family)